MEIIIFLSLLGISATGFFYGIITTQIQLKKRLLARYVSTRDLGEKLDLIQSLTELKSKKALKIFINELCNQVPIFLAAYYDEGTSDVVREKIAENLRKYAWVNKNALSIYFNALRKLVVREENTDVLSACIDTLAAWAKRLGHEEKKLLAVTIKYRLGIEDRAHKLVFIHMIRALLTIKMEALAEHVLKNALFMGAGKELESEIRKAIAL